MSLSQAQEDLGRLVDGMPDACRLRFAEEDRKRPGGSIWVDPDQYRRELEAARKAFGSVWTRVEEQMMRDIFGQ